MLTIDGSTGEGGGQILRSALALSIVTSTPFRIEKIRAARERPGLLRQHLTAVKAAAEICKASVSGAELGSASLTFVPGQLRPGDFAFAVGTAGSATLVLQTILPPLMTASAPSTVTLEGGTHNPAAPPYDFLVRTFLPLIGRMGAVVNAELERPGFYPAGGGSFRVSIGGSSRLAPLELMERKLIRGIKARAIMANLPLSIAQRELKVVRHLLSLSENVVEVDENRTAEGPGNVVMVDVETEDHTEVFTGFGEAGIRAEAVGTKVAQEVRSYLASGVPVGRYLADQLLIPMALAGVGTFRTGPLSRHAITNADVIRQFLGPCINLVEGPARTWRVEFNRVKS